MSDDQATRAILVGVAIVLLRPWTNQFWEKAADAWLWAVALVRRIGKE